MSKLDTSQVCHRLCAWPLIGASALFGNALAAGAEDTGDLALQQVVVSATRLGEQSLQSTPMAISVISPAQLDSEGRSGVSDFARTLPSVNMQVLSPGENDIEMRGLVTSAVDPVNAQERSLVGIYLDDASITQQAFNPDLHVYDLERVEVIRGPQGTLYGAGSMAGTIRLITRKPDWQAFTSDADASVSETDHGGTNYSVRGMMNMPLIDDHLAARLAVYRSDDSGYINNTELHETDSNPAYATQARLAVRWKPVDTLIVDASATLARLNALGRNAVFPQLGDYTYASLTPERFTDYFKLYNITADQDLTFAHLISSTSYTQRQLEEGDTTEYLGEDLLTPGVRLPSPNTNYNDIHDFQEELRLVSNPDQGLRWITGAYFDRHTRSYLENIPEPGFDQVFGAEIGDPTFNSMQYGTPTPNDVYYGTINVKERQFALFGEATYAIVPKLDLTIGARYFDFHDDFNLNLTGIAGAIGPGMPDTTTGEQSSSGANPRAVLSYKLTNDVMVYGEAARGFRYGGVNEPAPIELCGAVLSAIGLKESPVSFGPDSLWSYTLGEKGTFDDGRVLLNVDAFYVDWRDVQTVHDLSCGYSFTENNGKVKSQGFELETRWRATSAMTLALSASYTDAQANGAIPNLDAADGDRTPYFPRTIVSASGNYVVALPQGKIHFDVDYTYRSDAFTQFSPENPEYREIPSSKILNAQVTYAFRNWSIALYGSNLTNDHEVSRIDANTFGNVQPGDLQYWGRPLTIGLHLHVGF